MTNEPTNPRNSIAEFIRQIECIEDSTERAMRQAVFASAYISTAGKSTAGLNLAGLGENVQKETTPEAVFSFLTGSAIWDLRLARLESYGGLLMHTIRLRNDMKAIESTLPGSADMIRCLEKAVESIVLIAGLDRAYDSLRREYLAV